MGPGGITLFDAFAVGAEHHVVRAIRDPNDPTFQRVVDGMLGELQAAYDLQPRPAERTVEQRDGATIIKQPGLTVRETAKRIDIDAAEWRVHVEVLTVDKDVTLDPAMWAQ